MTQIEVAVSIEKVNKITREIELPFDPKFYSKNDDGVFFPKGLILFGIIPKYPNSNKTFLLVQVERGKQDYTDFVPSNDCKSDYWLRTSGLRKQAFEILVNPKYLDGFKEITQDEFESKRSILLNVYKDSITR